MLCFWLMKVFFCLKAVKGWKGIKYNQDQSSIMLLLELNFRHNAVALRVTLKSIMLKFSSIMNLTLIVAGTAGTAYARRQTVSRQKNSPTSTNGRSSSMAFHLRQNSSFYFKVLALYFTLQLQCSILFFSTQHVSIKLQIRYIDFKNSCFEFTTQVLHCTTGSPDVVYVIKHLPLKARIPHTCQLSRF